MADAGRTSGHDVDDAMRASSGEPAQDTPARSAWEKPALTRLPSLTELTLLTGNRIHGGGRGGSTVF